MRREQLEHILRAAAQVIKQKDLLVIGSQSVLASWDETKLPPEAVRSIEADVAPLDGDDEKSDLIDGSLGEGSQFHETFGIYAQGVSLKTAVLPEGWRDRLVKLDNPSTYPGRGLCLDPHDCVLSKMVAGRQKDYDLRPRCSKQRSWIRRRSQSGSSSWVSLRAKRSAFADGFAGRCGVEVPYLIPRWIASGWVGRPNVH